jgi:hypothetical protein
MKKILDNQELLAIFMPNNFGDDKLNFISDPDFPLQIGYHNRDKEEYCEPHNHKPIENIKSIKIQEFFYVIEGKAIIELFNKDGEKAADQIIEKGDSILLMSTHSIKFLEKTKMVEVKPGPYPGKEKEKIFIADKNDDVDQ